MQRSLLRSRSHWLYRISSIFVLLLFLLMSVTPWHSTPPTYANPAPQAGQDTCDDVRFLMANDIAPLPTTLIQGGGDLAKNAAGSGSLGPNDIGDYWYAQVLRPTVNNRPANARFQVQFTNLASGLNLEFQVFRGMVGIADSSGKTGYQPVTANTTYTYSLNEDGYYTVVVQRPDIANTANTGSYSITLNGDYTAGYDLSEIPDNSTGARFIPRPDRNTGLVDLGAQFSQTGQTVWIHANGVTSISSQNGRGAQTFFDNGSFNVGPWGQEISFAGGNLAIMGENEDGTPRIFYLEGFGYRTTQTNLDILNYTDSNNNKIRTDWNQIKGIWLLADCVGVKLQDGRTFVAPSEGPRDLMAGLFPNEATGCDIYEINVKTPDVSGAVNTHSLCFTWDGIAPNSEMRWVNSVLSMDLIGERQLEVQTIDLRMARDAAIAESPDNPNVPLNLTLDDQATTITLDWINMSYFKLVGGEIGFRFLDEPRSQNPNPTLRSGVNVERIEALNDIIQIIYKPSDTVAGEQRLLLPASESYLEIITPAGEPPFNAQALPSEIGYAPRALNNLGGECHAITGITAANCPPNGQPNPLNGNLWYAITDHVATGYLLDLDLTRSYNSMSGAIDGPFGRGWSVPYLVDYNLPFDTVQNARVINPRLNTPLPADSPQPPFEDDAYRVGLNLTWAPRGIVEFITPSGSRHIFTQQGGSYSSGELRALTMPGWRLSRSDIRADRWTLTTDVGLVYEFDRGGRIVRYGYPLYNRMIEINYPRTTLNGPAEVANVPIIISDAPSARQLELYFDQNHHVYRSVLRDLSLSESSSDTCAVEDNCFEILYIYQGDFLVEVYYPNGEIATYAYDDAGRLTYHNDHRAPIQPTMRYEYYDNGTFAAGYVLPEAADPATEGTAWRVLTEAEFNQNRARRIVRVTDERGNTREYQYRWASGNLRQAGDVSTIASETSPLSSVEGLDVVPIAYTWDTNGLLTSIDSRSFQTNIGRAGTTFTYTLGDGKLNTVSGGYSPLRITYDPAAGAPSPNPFRAVSSITYGDASTETFTYDEQTRVLTHKNQRGTVHAYTWDETSGWVSQIVESDGTVNSLSAVTWSYTYNEFGLPITLTQRSLADVNSTAVWTYRYDNLGRLLEVTDPALGSYTIGYVTIACSLSTDICAEITITDPVNSVTTALFDGRNRLLELTVSAPSTESPYLRRTTYEYNDGWGRLSAETRWLWQNDQETPLTTTYTYQDLTTLLPLIGTEDVEEFIGGYTLTVTNAYGRRTVYIYDALDRVRQIEDTALNITRFDYDVRNSGNNFGYRITQREYSLGVVQKTFTYGFDARWLLRSVEEVDSVGNTTRREFTYQTENSNLRNIVVRDVNIGDIQIGAYENGITTSANLPQVGSEDPQTRSELADIGLTVKLDSMGRPILLTDSENVAQAVAYCPLANGFSKEVLGLPAARTANVACETEALARAVTYDPAHRLVQVRDEFGSRTFTYTAQDGLWEVNVAAFPPSVDDEDVVTATPTFTWLLRYNALGDLLYWRDESGFEHFYRYDTLGRLIRVTTGDDNPETAFTFTYNNLNQVTSVLDDLGSGTVYTYNQLGQLTIAQNARTADSTVYTYDTNNRLSNIISPLGNTVSYLYEDRLDPTRLTGIIDATGSAHQFLWDPPNNRMTYTDPRGTVTVYRFDMVGGLWQISDNQDRTHELLYDSAGTLRQWFQTKSNNIDNAAFEYIWELADPTNGVYRLRNEGNTEWKWEYQLSPNGMINAVTNPANQRLVFAYDPFGRLTTITAGTEVLWQLNRVDGSPTIEYADDFGTAATLTYDPLYRLREYLTADDRVEYAYTSDDNTGNVILTITEPYGAIRTYEYAPGNAIDPPSITITANGQRVIYVYNPEGYLQEIVTETCMNTELLASGDYASCFSDRTTLRGQGDQGDAGQNRLEFETIFYDAERRPIRIIDSEQNIEVFSYDDYGNLITYQNANGKSFAYAYDDLNRLVLMEGPTGIKLLLAYDDLDRMTGICRTRSEASDVYNDCIQAGGLLEGYEYDTLGRLAVQRYPNVAAGNRELITALRYAYQNAAGAGLLTGLGLDRQQATFTRSYTDNGLSLLEEIGAGTSNYTFNYRSLDSLKSITGTNPLTFTYNQGRVSKIQAGNRSLEFIYNEDNSGYIVQTETGAALAFALDGRGFLVGIDYAASANELTPDAPDVRLDYTLSQFDDLLVVTLDWQDGSQIIDLLVNRLGDVQNAFYYDRDLYLDYQTQPLGGVTRQSLSGAPEFFASNAGDYVLVIGYNDDDRPLTLRVTDQQNGQLLYALAFTYDTFGQRRTENRQYFGGIQVNATYRYEGQQLVSRQVEIIYPRQTLTTTTDPASSLAPLTFLGLFVLMLWRDRRRGIVILVIVAMIAGAVALALPSHEPSEAQTGQGGNRLVFIYEYGYDAFGNLISITGKTGENGTSQKCADFTFDGAQRLTNATFNGSSGRGAYTYGYDAYNRVVNLNNTALVYAGDSNIPMVKADNSGSVLYGQLPDQRTMLLTGNRGEVQQVISNGRGSTLTLFNEGEFIPAEPIWLFDPLGRYAGLIPPSTDLLMTADTLNPCDNFLDTPSQPMLTLLPPQGLQQGMIWHGAANIYLVDGRAYLPSIGRFLQRDPHGPDAFGNIYESPNRQATPPIRQQAPTYMTGLYMVRSAFQFEAAADTLTAAAIREQFAPRPYGFSQNRYAGEILGSRTRVRAEIAQLYNFPEWVDKAFSLPTPYLDPVTREVRFAPDVAPAQGGRDIQPHLIDLHSALWQPNIWTPTPPPMPFTYIQQFREMSHVPAFPYQPYAPLGWRPMTGNTLLTVEDVWQEVTPRVEETPAAIVQWLNRPLYRVETMADSLDFIQALQAVPTHTGAFWVDTVLQESLPTAPTIPPQTMTDWAAQWFSGDTFGLEGLLGDRWAVPPPPSVPTYGIEDNPDWFFPLQGR